MYLMTIFLFFYHVYPKKYATNRLPTMETGITIDVCWTTPVELTVVFETVVVVVVVVVVDVVVVVVVVLLLTTPVPVVILPELVAACIAVVV